MNIETINKNVLEILMQEVVEKEIRPQFIRPVQSYSNMYFNNQLNDLTYRLWDDMANSPSTYADLRRYQYPLMESVVIPAECPCCARPILPHKLVARCECGMPEDGLLEVCPICYLEIPHVNGCEGYAICEAYMARNYEYTREANQ